MVIIAAIDIHLKKSALHSCLDLAGITLVLGGIVSACQCAFE